MIKGQTLLLVLFLLLLVSALVTGLVVMLRADIKIRSCQREGMAALYLAQAAVERGKIEVLRRCWNDGDTFTIVNSADLDEPGDNYQFRYDVFISNPAPPAVVTRRTIRGTGRVLDATGAHEIAHREINLDVDGIDDSAPADGIDDDGIGNEVAWTWQEI